MMVLFMKKQKFVFLLVLVILVFLGYSSYLRGDFVLDDEALILNSPVLSGKVTLGSIFTTSLYNQPYTYRPIQVLSYIIDHKIWGYNPFGFHLTSIIIHIINVFLIYYLLALIFPITLAQITAILFAVHPVNSSVVGYISSRADLLVFFFILLSVIFILKFINSSLKSFYFLSIFFGCLSYFCRENSLILFLLILLVVLINKVKYKRALLLATPFLLLSLIYFVSYSIFSRQLVNGFFPVQMSPVLIIVNFLNIIMKYLTILILPLNLHMFRSSAFILDFFNTRFILVVIFLIFSIYIIYKHRSNKPFLFGVFWFLIGLLPVVFILNRYPWLKKAMMAESWLYLSSSGFFLLFAICLAKFAKWGKIVLFSFVILCLYLTYQQHAYWTDNIASYKRIMQFLPKNNPVRKNLVRAYLKRNLYEEALFELNNFAASYPQSSERYVLQGDYYYAVKDFVRAKESYRIALSLNWRNAAIMEKLLKIEVENGK